MSETKVVVAASEAAHRIESAHRLGAKHADYEADALKLARTVPMLLRAIETALAAQGVYPHVVTEMKSSLWVAGLVMAWQHAEEL